MASSTQQTLSKLQEIVKEWKPGMLQSVGLQRVRHDLVTEQQQQQEHLQIEAELLKNTQKRKSDFLATAVHIHNLLFTFTTVISTWYFAAD